MKELVIGAIVRAVLQLASGAGFVLAEDLVMQAVMGLVALGTIVWSIYQKQKTTDVNVAKPLVVALVCGLTLSGCAGLSKGPEDCLAKVAATQIAVAQGYETADSLKRDGSISKSAAEKALVALDVANTANNNARPLCKIDAPKAADYLRQAGAAMSNFAALTADH